MFICISFLEIPVVKVNANYMYTRPYTHVSTLFLPVSVFPTPSVNDVAHIYTLDAGCKFLLFDHG